MKQALTALLCTVLLLLLSAGCSSDPAGKTFRYDIPDEVDNLDPQFATDPTARIILQNLFEGLVVMGADGSIQPGVAKSYTVSEDLLTYTFRLREDAAWEGGEPVTAQDFVFTFRRLFQDQSPHAGKYASIRGGRSVLEGGSADRLPGVSAQGSTLTITLETPEPLLLERLADPAAAPCNEAFFTEARGRYGLEISKLRCNGPFELSRWDAGRLSLRRNDDYRSQRETVAGGVVFYIGRNAAEQFRDGKSDLAILTREEQEGGAVARAEILPIQKTVWCIVFNQDHRIWGNALLRQGLAMSIDHQLLGTQAPDSFHATDLFVPGALQVLGKPYRGLAFGASPLEFDTQEAVRLFQMGLDALEIGQLPSSATIHIPEEAKMYLGTDDVQQSWQKYLSAYINFEVNTPAEIQTMLRSGDYQMLLMPMTPADSAVDTLLGAFASDSGQNYFGYRNVIYDELLESAAAQHTPQEAASRYAQAEAILLSDAVVIPLYFETSYMAVAQGVEGLEISPFGDRIYFKYAQKDG